MKKLTCLLLILFSFLAFPQSYQEESTYEDQEESFKYDPSDDGQLEYPVAQEVYDDGIANESTEEAYIFEGE
jgi:hypothetical protein